MKLLLHICCGPCTLYPARELLSKKFDEITGFFYNPNIHPPSEYKSRRDTLFEVASKIGLKIIIPDYKMEEYFRAVLSKEGSPERCLLCWELRLSETASFAKDNGFDAFTTTLLISPYQDHENVKKIGENAAAQKGIQFYYQDFRPGFKLAQDEAKKQNLYRQKYCGCVFSELERIKII